MLRAGRPKSGADSVLSVLSAALGQAVRSGKVGRNVTKGIWAKPRPRPRQVPTRAEADAMLAAVYAEGDPRWMALYGLAIGHGLRQSETLGLMGADRSRDGRTLTVNRKMELRTGRTDEEPKDGSVRSLVLLPWVAQALDALGPRKPGELLFPPMSKRGVRMNGHTLLDHVHALSARLELAHRYDWHSLRHVFGTRMADLGNSPASIQQAMGHRDYRTTTRYLHPGVLVDDLAVPLSPAPVPLPVPLRHGHGGR